MASAVLSSGSNQRYWSHINNNAASPADYDPRQRVPINPNPTRIHAPPVRRPPSHNAAPTTSFSNSDHRKCVTFHLSSYSRRELIQLKKRLISELDQVRRVRTRIDTLPDSRTLIPVPPPPPPPKKNKSISKESSYAGSMPAALSLLSMPQVSKLKTSMMRKCNQILNKLMKHKHGWVFNKPVDAASLGLHDYHTIIRKPMDLGTVKSKMSKEGYKTPLDFAGDVRLTFNNAMAYNPKGQDVYLMAQDLLTLFDSMFNPAFQKYESEIFGVRKNKQKGVSLPMEPALHDQPHVGPVGSGMKLGKAEKANKVSKRDLNGGEKSRKRGAREEKLRKREQLAVNVEVESRRVDMNGEVESRMVVMNVEAKSRKVDEVVFSKKEMSFEEKSRLAIGLQELPQPKLDEMVKIIKKRNMHLAPDCDETEMELDIEVIDNETLWELDRLVKDNEKMLQSGNNGESLDQNGLLSGLHYEERNKKEDAGDEEVDIGDECPANFPPLEIERDGSSRGSGSSSSSDSSSSGDSDSSGSNSDGESVQSPFVQARGEGPEMA